MTEPEDQLLRGAISRLLKIGVLLSVAVVLVGGVMLLAQQGRTPIHFTAFRGEPAALTHLTGIIRGAVSLDAAAIAQLGLVLLIATPIARVALTFFAFLVRRDWTYVALTATVLALLSYGLLSGGS